MSAPQSDPTNDPAYLTEEQKKAGVVLREHVYDGIREYDQRLPNWWLFTLYIFIVWFVVFWFAYYQLGMFKTDEQEMDIAMAAIQFKKEKQLNTLLADLDEDAIWEMSRDPVAVSAGQAHFNQFCAVCHAADLSATLNGTPLPGVALNDSQWKYCRKPTDVFNIITKGSPDVTKGMVAWDAILGPKKIAETTAFVLSHHDADSPWEPTADSPEGLDFTTPASTPETTPTPTPTPTPAPTSKP